MLCKVINIEAASGYKMPTAVGKKILRPGGRSATKQLLQWAGFQPGETVLELAASLGEGAIAMAQQYQVKVVTLERDPDSVALARANIAAAGLSDQIEVIEGSVLQLDLLWSKQSYRLTEKFDYILAEAILTMQSASGKAKILGSIKDHLKPGGKFLSHELMASNRETEIHEVLSAAIRVNSTPLSEKNWIAAYESAGLVVQQDRVGAMKLLNPWQILRDECTKAMLNVFYKYREDLGYIIMTASLPI